MFFITYLRRELRRRIRQAVLIALGLAVGIGLVLTVTAASAGVKKAQADVLSSLYGVGTDVTVTGKPPEPLTPGSRPPGGAQVCTNGTCHKAAGQTINNLGSGGYSPFSQSAITSVASLRHVTAAAGGLTLSENRITLPQNFGQPGGRFP